MKGLTELKCMDACSVFNKDNAVAFGNRHADKKFLAPLGIGDRIDPHFGNNEEKFTKDTERLHFEALHFVRYRLHRALKARKNKPFQSTKEIIRYYQCVEGIRNRCICANIGLVGKCLELTSINYDYDILFSLGCENLFGSVKNFDPWKGWRFSTYACRAIFRSFMKAISKGVPIDKSQDPTNVLIHDVEDGDLVLYISQLSKILDSNVITDHEREILQYRFGMKTGEAMTLEQVGKIYKISKERVRQIQKKVLAKIKEQLKEDPLLQ